MTTRTPQTRAGVRCSHPCWYGALTDSSYKTVGLGSKPPVASQAWRCCGASPVTGIRKRYKALRSSIRRNYCRIRFRVLRGTRLSVHHSL